MIADVLRSMPEYPALWSVLHYVKTEVSKERVDIYRFSGVLGYEQDVLMMLFETAGLVAKKSVGYSARSDQWVSIIGYYDLSNAITRSLYISLNNYKL